MRSVTRVRARGQGGANRGQGLGGDARARGVGKGGTCLQCPRVHVSTWVHPRHCPPAHCTAHRHTLGRVNTFVHTRHCAHPPPRAHLQVSTHALVHTRYSTHLGLTSDLRRPASSLRQFPSFQHLSPYIPFFHSLVFPLHTWVAGSCSCALEWSDWEGKSGGVGGCLPCSQELAVCCWLCPLETD